MPELPEVETIRLGLEPVLAGRMLAQVVQRRADLRWPLPADFSQRLTGQRVASLRRRSKYLLIDLDCGETWILHLGMSGRLLIAAPARPTAASGAEPDRASPSCIARFHHEGTQANKHDHVIVETDAGDRITYNDARRFGAMDLWPTAALDRHWLLARLGPEPLGNAFSGDTLARALTCRQTSIKAALLDQRIVAGLGNIYACEALHRAGIDPRRIAGTIARSRIERLTIAIRETLRDAILAGGSSLRDYRRADGELGYFQHRFRVYDREGQACPRGGCTGVVRRLVQSGRSSFLCPRCQR